MWNNFKAFLDRNPVIKHILMAAGTLFLLILLTLLWLRFYTNHGQKLVTPSFVGMDFKEAERLADRKSFQLINADSFFVVDKKGGEILNQNPKADAEVKSGRKIYVTTTKYTPDQVSVADLPILYGNDFNQKTVELGYRGIRGRVRGRKYDPGEPNHILEVYYKNELIISGSVFKDEVMVNKGDELEFIVSDKETGEVLIPNLVCLSFSEAEFSAAGSKIEIGEITTSGSVSDRESAFVIKQDPPSDLISKMPMGGKINVTLATERPSSCDE